MIVMSEDEFIHLHKKVKVGTILLVPKDPNTENNYNIPPVYEAEVIQKDNLGFTTQLHKIKPHNKPLYWNRHFNFKGTKIK